MSEAVARRTGMLRSMPRRERLSCAWAPPDEPAGAAPKASFWALTRRGLRWSTAFFVMNLRMAQDRAQGRKSVRDRARRLRELFEAVGGTAIKLGQQLSIRRDVLPVEMCEELSGLMDKVPPIPWPLAERALSAALGRPWQACFSSIDPEPIGSASIATVYKGTLHDGTVVAIKVQRPEVHGQFSADLTAFELFTHVLEAVGAFRPHFFENMRYEVRSMFMEEVDFRLEARYAALFRRQARDVLPWVEVPQVFRALSSVRILVTAFVKARPITDLLAARESGDEAALAAFAAEGTTPQRVAERIILLSAWSRFEAPFFHADPHPANLLLLPDSRLVLLDFGACGVTSRSSAMYQVEFMRRMVDHDIAGLAAVSLANLSPVPYVELSTFRRMTEAIIGRYMSALDDHHAHWSERTTAALWLAVVEISQKFQLPMNLETLRMIRSTLLYDSLAYRLHGDMGTGITPDYLEGAARRHARSVRRTARRLDARTSVQARLLEAGARAEVALDRMAAYAESVSRQIEVGLGVMGVLGVWAVQGLRAAVGGTALALVAWTAVWLGPPLPWHLWRDAIVALRSSPELLLPAGMVTLTFLGVAQRVLAFHARNKVRTARRPVLRRRYLS